MEAQCPHPEDGEGDSYGGAMTPVATVSVTDNGETVALPCHLYTVHQLKIEMSAYASDNTASKHHLVGVEVLGVNPAGLHTPLPTLISQLQQWLRDVGTHECLRDLASRASLSLAMSSGALSALLRHAQTALVLEDAPLGSLKPDAHQWLAFLEEHRKEVASKKPALAGVSRVVDLCWDAESSYPQGITVEEDGKLVKNPSMGNVNCVTSHGFSTGKVFWEMQLVTDSRNGECTCFGAVVLPVTSNSYQNNNFMYYRCYNGRLYAATGVAATSTSLTKIHPDDIVRIDLDCDEKTMECVAGLVPWLLVRCLPLTCVRARVFVCVCSCCGRLSVNGVSQGIVFKDWTLDGDLYPAVNCYSSNRAIRIIRCERLSGFVEAPAAAAADATAAADADSSDEEEEPPTPEAIEAAHPGVTGLAAALDVPLESCAHAMQLAGNNVEAAADWLLTNSAEEAARFRALQSRREAKRERKAKREAELAAKRAAGDVEGADGGAATAEGGDAATAADAADADGGESAGVEETKDFSVVEVDPTPATHHEFINALLARLVEVSDWCVLLLLLHLGEGRADRRVRVM